MYMQFLDWVVVIVLLLVVVGLVLYVKRYVRGVADFLAGNRMAGRYLLTVAGEMGTMGAISLIAIWESQYFAGWGATWWGVLKQPATLIIVLSGWVIYRYRQTRSLTLAQFFEQRYSRNFRVFSGLIAFVSGVINYAIFPSVAARFIIYVCGIPEMMVSLGGFPISLSYAGVMALMLGFALWITLRTGQVGIMVTDGIQGVLILLLVLGLAVYLVQFCGWTRIGEALMSAPNAETNSMVNPFKTGQVRDFNLWFYAIGIFASFYGRMAWQGTSGYYAAAKSPHEARMAGVLSILRVTTSALILGGIGMAAYTIMHHPDFAVIAGLAQERLVSILNPAIQKQMTVPIVVATALPVGLLGCFVAAILSMAVTTDDTYLLSWGSIFIQDVVLPFRKKPLSQTAHMRLLRWSVAGVALFAYLFSLLFRQTQYIFMFFAITGAMFTAGAGSAIIGGLYWKRGTAGGAWAAMLTGSILAVSAVLIQQQPFHRIPVSVDAPAAVSVLINEVEAVKNGTIWTAEIPMWRQEEWQSVRVSVIPTAGERVDGAVFYAYGDQLPVVERPADLWPSEMESVRLMPAAGSFLPVAESKLSRLYYNIRCINGQWMWLFSILIAIFMYIVFSLSGRRITDMDKLLHRKQYALADVPDATPVRGWRAVFKITNEFSRGDRIIYFTAMSWSLGWMVIYLTLIVMNLIEVRSDHFWVKFFQINFYISIAAGVITVIWFGIGAMRDMGALCRGLASSSRDDADDGHVDKK